MPKIKTKHTVARRIKITSGGKLLRRMSHTGHLKTKKARKRKRRLKRYVQIPSGMQRKIKRLLPGT